MKLDHIAINSENIKESISWYKKNIGCKVIYEDESWGMIRSHNTVIAFVSSEQHKPHIAFKVDRIEDMPCDKGLVREHRDGSLYYYDTDPSGNIIEWIYWPDRSL